jgi:putative ABC transport system permease protein
MIRTLIQAWHAGVEASAKDRLITRNATSLVFYLPLSYQDKIARVPGVARVGRANWFGGEYKEERFTFDQFAIDENWLDVYPEFSYSAEAREAFLKDRRGALIGRDVANQYGLKVGDTVQLKGTIFPGLWEFTVQGIMEGRDAKTITRILLFNWDYLNERNKAELNRQVDQPGIFVIQLKSGANPAIVAKEIDALFANSYAETLTETETAFQQSFVSMSGAIITTLNVVSGVVVLIILLVLANTMFMAVRERYREYAILKAIGFKRAQIRTLIFGEALILVAGGLLLLTLILLPIFLSPPEKILGPLNVFFPIFALAPSTVLAVLVVALVLGTISAAIPYRDIVQARVTDGLRRLG